MSIFGGYSIVNEANADFIKNYKIHIFPGRRGKHDAAIKVVNGKMGIMELEIVSNLGHNPSFDEIMDNAKVVAHISKKDKDYNVLYNALVGFEYHYYDIIINYINNRDKPSEDLLSKAGKEYTNKLKGNPSLSKIKRFEPKVTLAVKETAEFIEDFEFDEYFNDELE